MPVRTLPRCSSTRITTCSRPGARAIGGRRRSSRPGAATGACTGAASSTTRRACCSTSPRSAPGSRPTGALPVNVKWVDRGRGGDRLRAPRGIPARAPRAARLRRARALRHREPRHGHPVAHDQPARDRAGRRHRARARSPDPQRHVGRAGARRRDRADLAARAARRRARRDRGAGLVRRRARALAGRARGARRAPVRRGRVPPRRGDGSRHRVHRRERPHDLRAPLAPAVARADCARGHAARDRRESADGRGARADRRARRAGSGCAADRRSRGRVREARSAGGRARGDRGALRGAGLEDARGGSRVRRRAPCAARGLRARCGGDRLRRLDSVRGSVRRGARRRSGAAPGARRPALQCPRGEREPRPRGLPQGRA